MATSKTSTVIRHLRRAVLLRDGAGLTDGQLLECFIDHRDEAAFAALVKRHGPMVWGVCRRLLGHHDAEDAFQATFLILCRKAASIQPRQTLANWLYGVAHKTALAARRALARRRAKERQVTEMPEPAVSEQDLWSDLQPLLDAELSCLPDKYRSVIVLCDLEGKTRNEAARQLGWPEGTVAGRLARARVMLAKRLTQRGIALSSGALALVLSQKVASAGVPTSVVSSTINAASLFAAGRAVAAGAISAKVAGLTEGVLKSMLLTKLKNVTVALLVFVVIGFGVSASTHLAPAQNQPETKKSEDRAETPTQQKTEKRKGKLDLSRRSDFAKRIIRGAELLDLGKGVPGMVGDWWNLSVGPTTEIMIDRKKAQLDDLQKVVQAVGNGHLITVIGEWEFDVLKPRYSEQHGRAMRIEVKGRQVEGVVQTINAGKNIIAITQRPLGAAPKSVITHEVAKDVEVVIDGKAARFSDLKPNMQVSLQMSAVKDAPDVAVTALGPQVEGVVRTVNAEKNTIGVNVPSIQMTAEGVPVAMDAKVVIGGRQGKLSDVKTGMLVTLQMCAETDKSVVVGITTGKTAKEQ